MASSLGANTSKTIAVRLPHDLANAIETACKEHGITASEFVRGLVSQWVYGSSQLSGPDEGYAQARSMATQLAHLFLRRAQEAIGKAIEELPDTHESAVVMLQGLNGRRG